MMSSSATGLGTPADRALPRVVEAQPERQYPDLCDPAPVPSDTVAPGHHAPLNTSLVPAKRNSSLPCPVEVIGRHELSALTADLPADFWA